MDNLTQGQYKATLQNDIRLLEKQKKGAIEDLARLDAVKSQESKQYKAIKDLHTSELETVRFNLSKLQTSFDLLKKAYTQTETQLKTLNESEIVQTREKADFIKKEADDKLIAAETREKEVRQKAELLSLQKRDLEALQTTINERNLQSLDRETEAKKKLEMANERMSHVEEDVNRAFKQIEGIKEAIEKLTGEKKMLEAFIIDEKTRLSEIRTRYEKKEKEADALIKEYLAKLGGLNKRGEELGHGEKRLADRVSSFEANLRLFREKGGTL